MKKIILLIGICGMMGGVRGQTSKDAISSLICPGDMWIYPDTFAPLYLMLPGSFFNGCNGFPSAGGETVYHFTAPCTQTYTLEYEDYNSNISVSSRPYYWDYCDSTGYTCLTPVYIGNDKYKIDLALDSGLSYDFLFEYADTTNYMSSLIMKEPHVSDIEYYDITPGSVSVSWDGNFDDMVIEYGPQYFVPGNDTIAGPNGIVVHNPVSPYTFTGLIPDSVYDFYFRDKCGVFSPNTNVIRKRIPNCSNLPSLNCNTFSTFLFYPDTEYYPASWTMDSCGNSTHYSREKIFTFTPDTSGFFSFEHYSGQCSTMEIGIYYKESSLGCNEHNWTCIGAGSNAYTWSASFGPLTAGTNYHIMFKSNHHICGPLSTGFKFICPSSACSVAPDSITSNATNNTICSGQSVTLTQAGGVLSSNGFFLWYADSCGGTAIGNGYSATFTPTDTITYYVRAEDSCGVTACASITITVNPSPAPPAITGDTTICAGTSTILTASAGYACYLWSMASTTQSVTVSNTGIYMVTVCDANGCTASASVAVIVYPIPVPVITGNTTICQGSSVTLNPGLAYYCYMWSNGATTATINVSTSGTYTVTVCDANGCTGSASATVTVIPNPVPVITGSTTICQGSSTTLNAGAGYTSYLWSTSTTTQIINVSVASPYTVTVTNANLCTGSASIVVTVNPAPTPVITGNTTICQGSSATLNAGAGYACYVWSTGTITQTINVTFAGIYTVTVCDANGCTGSASVTVTINPNPVAVITPSVTTYICLGDTVHFTANTGAGFIYQWYKNSLPISGAVNSFYDAFASGNYSFAVTDSNGCYSLSSFTHVHIICFPPLEPSELRMTTESNDDIVLIPNPASHEITIQTGRALQSIKIFDVVGQQVYSQQPETLRITIGIKPETKINISNFSKGIYFVILDTGKEKVVKKFLKE
ncbi:MAG TPA: T9SS type A sorting domain-containing protein [Bacteroidia bacterium]|nr:T9SS type A sorting domain-containing protein [Bacteroidia bacterium]